VSFVALLVVLVLGSTIVELARLRAATVRLARHRVDAALDVATGLLARRHGMVRFRVELRRARRAGRSITVHELRAPSPAVLDAIGTQLAPSVTYPDVALRVSPVELVLLQSHADALRQSTPRLEKPKPYGCTLATRTVGAADQDGFVELERYADEVEADDREHAR